MKKLAIILLSLCLLPALSLAEELELDGTVEAAHSVALLAPYSGVITEVGVKAGDVLEAGHPLLSIASKAVYADFDGLVTALFAAPGDSVASVEARYGALCYVERNELYQASCTNAGAASGSEYKVVHVGERVYLRSTQDQSREGEAMVTGAQGGGYTLTVTNPGDLRVDERIKVYRDERRRASECIGSGVLSRIDPVGVTGEGSVLAVHVQAGQRVSRGDLLFELVPDALPGMRGGDGVVTLPQDGVVLGVEAQAGAQAVKDGLLITYCPAGEIELVCQADEDDLSGLSVGDAMLVTLDAYPGDTLNATVTEISGAGARENGRVTFAVTLALEENDLARVGMSATAVRR